MRRVIPSSVVRSFVPALLVPIVILLAGSTALFRVQAARADCVSYQDFFHPLGGHVQSGYPCGMEYRPPYLFLSGSDGYFTVLDATDPGRLLPAGSVMLPAAPRGLEVAGNLGYVILSSRSLQIVDLSDPHAPHLLGSAAIPSGPTGVAVAGAYAFVTATQYPGEEGLYVFDVADPMAPSLITRLDVGWMPGNVEIDGTFAYVLASGALSILDISNPIAPIPVGAVTIPGQGAYLACRENHVYVVCRMSEQLRARQPAVRSWGDGLYVIDRSDPTHPWVAGAYAPEEEPPFVGIALWNQYAIVSYPPGIGFIDISDPSDPQLVHTLGVQRYGERFASSGSVLFVWGDGLVSYRLEEPFTPEPVAFIDGTDGCGATTSRGDHVYAAQTYGRDLFVIDLSDPEAPVVTATETLPFEGVMALAVTGNESRSPYVYVAGNGHPDSTAILDVSDPYDPRLVNFMILPHHPTDLAIDGGYLYSVEGATGVRIYDLADPVRPVPIATIPFTFSPQILTVSAQRLYVGRRISNMEHLFIYDVADPADPELLGTSMIPQSPYKIELEGDLAFVADGEHGLVVLDVSDPSAVAAVSRVESIGDAYDLQRDGDLVYVADGNRDAGLQVVDVSDPSAPEVIGFFQTDQVRSIERISGHILATNSATRAVVAPMDCASSDVPANPQTARAARLSLWPNPVHGPLDLLLTTSGPGQTRLALFDPAGRLVRVLHDGWLPSGVHSVRWDGRDGRGRAVPAGVYFVRATTEAGTVSSSVVQVR
jgi:hypothetical protein